MVVRHLGDGHRWSLCVKGQEKILLVRVDYFVRIFGFKLKGGGGEWFKEGFQKLLSQEWKYFENNFD